MDSCKDVWFPEIQKFFGNEIPAIVLVGTKQDLVENAKPGQRVSTTAAQHVANDVSKVF